jgi:hypothetical protein
VSLTQTNSSASRRLNRTRSNAGEDAVLLRDT